MQAWFLADNEMTMTHCHKLKYPLKPLPALTNIF